MQRAVNGFYAKLKRGMTGLVFFSGYGIQANRQSYLIPVDVDIWNETEVQPKGVALDNILAEMNKRGANVKIAIVDAARRNPFERRFRKAGAEGLPPVSAPLGTLVLYSATAGTPGGLVKDSSAERSLFVGELVKEIRGQGVSAEEVFNRTRMGVSRASANEQNPWISSSLSQEFSFPSCGRGASPQPPPRVANTTNTNTGTSTNPSVNTGGSTTASNTTNTFDVQSTRPQPPACVVANVPSPKPTGTPPSDELKSLDERVRRNTRDAVAFYRRGQFYARYSQFNRAISDFDEAIRLKPDDPEALNNRCWARAMLGDTTKALQDCNEALKLRPAYGDALDSRGLINLKLCKNLDALSDYELGGEIQSAAGIVAVRARCRQAADRQHRWRQRRHRLRQSDRAEHRRGVQGVRRDGRQHRGVGKVNGFSVAQWARSVCPEPFHFTDRRATVGHLFERIV